MLPLLVALLLAQAPGPKETEAYCTKAWLAQEAPTNAETRRCRDWWLTVPYGPPGEEGDEEAEEMWLQLDPMPGQPEAAEIPTRLLERAEAHIRRACAAKCTWRDKRAMEYFEREAWYRVGHGDLEFVNLAPGLKLVLEGKPVLVQPIPREHALRQVSLDSLRRLRNAVFARHGRPFSSVGLEEFFYTLPRSKEWRAAGLPVLKQGPGYSDAKLTDVDRQNLASIQALEREAKKELEAWKKKRH